MATSWSSTAPTSWAADRTAGGRTGPGPPGGCTSSLLVADVPYDEVVLVLEGAAKGGVRPGRDGHVRTVHAPRSGDDDDRRRRPGRGRSGGDRVTVVTADRMLQARVQGLGASALSPSWLLDQL